jgi:hypothetical protein
VRPDRLVDQRDPAAVSVTIHHRCSAGAAGSALGPYERVAYWIVDGGALHVLGIDEGSRVAVVAAVWAELGGSPGDRVRAAQDLAADAVD